MSDKLIIMEAIKRVDDEILETKSKLKDLRADYNDQISALPEYAALQDILLEVKRHRDDLRIAVSKDLAPMATEIEDVQFKLSDLKEILSHHLLSYYEETGAKVIVQDNDDRPIEMTAKLGKRTPHQESMFSEEEITS